MPALVTATVDFRGARCRYRERYIHKYYLPSELKGAISPADINGLLRGHEWWGGCIPRKLPECRIHYKDIGLDKLVPGAVANRVLQAVNRYVDDCGAPLTEAEQRAAMRLNAFLATWEQEVLAELIRTSETLERRVRAADPLTTDYEVELEVDFYVRNDDPFSEDNNPEASVNDIDENSALLCRSRLLAFAASRAEADDPEYWGVGDCQDHNDRGCGEGIYRERHCATFHEIYDHLHVPMKHMGRIGSVYTDIRARQLGCTCVPSTWRRKS